MLNKAVIIKLDIFISKYMSTYGILLLRYSLAMVFIWFGLLKPLGISPAQELVENTVYWFDDKADIRKFPRLVGSSNWIHNVRSTFN